MVRVGARAVDLPARSFDLARPDVAPRLIFVDSQASVPELTILESDPAPARLVLYSNLPIVCQSVTGDNSPTFCWIKFTIKASGDIAMRQRTAYDSDSKSAKNLCVYRLDEADWKPDERKAYDGNKSLDIVAKVHSVT